jgi:hypothetical protein
MKHEIIYTDDYALIVSDEKINDVRPYKGKYHIEKGYIINQFPNYLTDLSDCKLIIAHRPLIDAPILKDVPLLPKFSEEDDVEKKSRDFVKYVGGSQEQRLAFIDGYLEAKETYKYTEKDLMNLVEKGHEIYNEVLGVATDAKKQKLIDFISFLQQPKRPKYFECEMEQLPSNESFGLDYGSSSLKPKTTINSQGQTELKGEYIYG